MHYRIKALLFDLDDTLLGNNMEGAFLQRYLDMLTRRIAHLMDPELFVRLIWDSTEAMTRNNDDTRTLQQVFWDDFSSRTDVPKEKLLPLLMDFYINDFPALEKETRRLPDARPVIQAAFDRGYDVVIATKPLFPRIAIEHRLAWAGIDDFEYALITSYEVMHFCKPHPRYFLEIAERLDHRPEECLMIGNDPADDMAAGKVGMKTFYIEGTGTKETAPLVAVSARGSLRDLLCYIETGDLHDL